MFSKIVCLNRSTSSSQSSKSGYLPDFGVAKELGLPMDSPIFKKILEAMKCDDEWEDCGLQATYKALGLKRYHFDSEGTGLVEKVTEDKHSEGVFQ